MQLLLQLYMCVSVCVCSACRCVFMSVSVHVCVCPNIYKCIACYYEKMNTTLNFQSYEQKL